MNELQKFHQKRRGKYGWMDECFINYCKKEAEKLRAQGFEIGTAGVSRLLHDKVLVPNQVDLGKLVQPRIRMKKNGKNKLF